MKLIIGGGGPGGHLFPGVALAREFERRFPDCQVLFIGTEKGLESRIIPAEGFKLRTIPATGLVGRKFLAKAASLVRLPLGLGAALGIARDFRPDLVIGVGGYSSGPVVLASWLLRIPRVLLEPNSVPGLTNRILGPLSDRIYLAFEEAGEWFSGPARRRIRVLGNPTGEAIAAAGAEASPRSRAGEKPLTVLVMGGSQGAEAINRAVCAALKGIKKIPGGIHLIHQTGERDLHRVEEAYRESGMKATVTAFIRPVATAYQNADLVISRAGATTVAELTASGKPAVLIPFPHATHGHQEENARRLSENGAAVVLLEKDLSGTRLEEIIGGLAASPGTLDEMGKRSRALGRPKAAADIVEDCVGLIREKGRG
ncbi:MAG TPA: undecaprenyldiphospho-muramoylpentapeptide beta-N-acetylglucosaminyltransferase, partial [Nitrospiria bacterium]|nr:undecaprenyldiphospho-muramoylpentapeptide beta-N-acetylglucosaminyltransferase [Nitrospiria bacterium]